MNDFSEIENELRKLRPARPSPILFERIEEAMDCKASVSDAGSMAGSSWRRFTERPYSFGLGLAAATIVLVFAALSVQRMHEGEEVAQTSSTSQTQSSESRVEAPVLSHQFVPAGATRLVYNTRDEGLQFARGSDQPLRRLRYQTHQTWQWRNPTTGASLRVSYPSEEVVLIPVSGE